jgi:hypothetical protein
MAELTNTSGTHIVFKASAVAAVTDRDAVPAPP